MSAVPPASAICFAADAFVVQRARFKESMQQRYSIPDQMYDAVTQLVAPLAMPMQVAKGAVLQRVGDQAHFVYWITSGVIRTGFFTAAGSDVTIGFATEGVSATPYTDLLYSSSGLPASCFMVAETDVEVFRVEWVELMRLLPLHAVLEQYHVKVVEYMLKQQHRRSVNHIGASATQRLDTFLSEYPGLESRISQKVLASYLEITPQYLSQLLKRLRKA